MTRLPPDLAFRSDRVLLQMDVSAIVRRRDAGGGADETALQRHLECAGRARLHGRDDERVEASKGELGLGTNTRRQHSLRVRQR